jgi:hypothetical protein
MDYSAILIEVVENWGTGLALILAFCLGYMSYAYLKSLGKSLAIVILVVFVLSLYPFLFETKAESSEVNRFFGKITGSKPITSKEADKAKAASNFITFVIPAVAGVVVRKRVKKRVKRGKW